MMNKALFLDRDGVINVNYGYVHEINNCQFIDGIFDLTRYAVSKNYKIIIVTNQSGIGRGYYTENQFYNFMKWMSDVFKSEGVMISKVYYSPYHPIHGKGKYKKDDFSRKPNPGMLIDAIKEFNIDTSLSVLIGDSVSDIEAGIVAGIGTNLFLSESEFMNQINKDLYHKISHLSEGLAFLSINKP